MVRSLNACLQSKIRSSTGTEWILNTSKEHQTVKASEKGRPMRGDSFGHSRLVLREGGVPSDSIVPVVPKFGDARLNLDAWRVKGDVRAPQSKRERCVEPAPQIRGLETKSPEPGTPSQERDNKSNEMLAIADQVIKGDKHEYRHDTTDIPFSTCPHLPEDHLPRLTNGSQHSPFEVGHHSQTLVQYKSRCIFPGPGRQSVRPTMVRHEPQ